MNEFNELNDGLIIVDLLKNLCKKLNILENYFYEFLRISKIKVTPKERLEFVINNLAGILLKNEFEDKITIDLDELEVFNFKNMLLMVIISYFINFQNSDIKETQ